MLINESSWRMCILIPMRWNFRWRRGSCIIPVYQKPFSLMEGFDDIWPSYVTMEDWGVAVKDS